MVQVTPAGQLFIAQLDFLRPPLRRFIFGVIGFTFAEEKKKFEASVYKTRRAVLLSSYAATL
jgi:hypothetical protein